MNFKIALAVAAATLAIGATAQTKWDLPAGYAATNFHSVNLAEFANDVDKATAGKLKITVHANGSLFKAPEIKRAVQGGQAQVGEILLANFQNEWQLFGADGLPFLADSYDESEKLYKLQIKVYVNCVLFLSNGRCPRRAGISVFMLPYKTPDISNALV